MARKKWVSWIPAIVWMGLIFYVSSLPNPMPIHERLLNLVVKKSGHFVGYGILAILYRLALIEHQGIEESEAVPWSWGLALFYAATDEFHQSMVPGRHSSALDVMIDGAGALAGLWAVHRIRLSKQAQGATGATFDE